MPPPEPLPAPAEVAIPEPELPPCERIERLDVYKSARELHAHCEGGRVRVFTVALGREPLGPKLVAGDQRTPEGEYRISGPARPSRFHRFLPFDYPSLADVERAHRLGIVNDSQYEDLKRALAAGSPVPVSLLGGGLGFHGEGARWRGDTPYLDWTNGCIALSDADLDFMADRVEPGVPVRVHP